MTDSPQIKTFEEIKLVGKRLKMRRNEYKTFELWRSFMPHRTLIKQTAGSELFSASIYDTIADRYSDESLFEKWATLAVTTFEAIPPDMETLIIPKGLYAVFHYKGVNTDPSIFIYIFTKWLPNSSYELDNRPHFEILGEKYKNGDPHSEEDICIPIKKI